MNEDMVLYSTIFAWVCCKKITIKDLDSAM